MRSKGGTAYGVAISFLCALGNLEIVIAELEAKAMLDLRCHVGASQMRRWRISPFVTVAEKPFPYRIGQSLRSRKQVVRA